MANLRGGPDNITAVIAKVGFVPPDDEAEAPSPAPPAAGPAVHPAVWGIMALCIIVAVSLAALQFYMAALIGGLLAAVMAVVALVQTTSPAPPGETFTIGAPLGKGPHATFDCAPNGESVAVLCQMAQQLREAAKEEHWTLDWPRFNNFGDQAHAALLRGDFGDAIRQHALAISFMMNEMRHQPSRKDQRDRTVLDR